MQNLTVEEVKKAAAQFALTWDETKSSHVHSANMHNIVCNPKEEMDKRIAALLYLDLLDGCLEDTIENIEESMRLHQVGLRMMLEEQVRTYTSDAS